MANKTHLAGMMLEIFGGVVGEGAVAGTKNSVGRVPGVVFHLEDRFFHIKYFRTTNL